MTTLTIWAQKDISLYRFYHAFKKNWLIHLRDIRLILKDVSSKKWTTSALPRVFQRFFTKMKKITV